MTSKTWTRKQFLELTVKLVGTTAVLGSIGCPGDDDTGDDGAMSSTGGSGDPPATDSGSTGTTPPETTSGPGESSGGPGDSTGSASECGTGADAEIGTNHGHSLFVPIADIEAGVEVTYDITGSSQHAHEITLTPDQLAMLLEGMSVVVASTVGNDHTHEVTVSC